MATSASSNLSSNLAPEEVVRQKLLHQMVHSLGYPRESISVEIPLQELPHLSGQPLPDCRLDLLVFAKGIHPDHSLFPLLLIECKAASLNQKAWNQLYGYNSYVQAPFIALASGENIHFGWREGANYSFINHLPTYQEVLASLRK